MELHNVKLLTNPRFPSTLTVSFMDRTIADNMGTFLCEIDGVFIGKPDSYCPVADIDLYVKSIISVYINLNEAVKVREGLFDNTGVYRIDFLIIDSNT